MSKKGGLGRGLGSIIPETAHSYEKSLSDHSGSVVDLDMKSIIANPNQPRKVFDKEALRELANSIETHGLLQPIIVYEHSDGEYIIIAGERRYRAYELLKKTTIQAIIIEINEDRLQEMALIENIQREDLNPIELAQAYKELLDKYHLTHEELASKVSKSRGQITNTLRLLTLSSSIQEWISEGKLSHGHAKMLVPLSKEEQEIVANSIIGQRLTVRETEELLSNIKSNKQSQKKSSHSASIHKKDFISLNKVSSAVNKLKENAINAKINKNRLIVEFRNETEWEKFIKILSTSIS